jgi:SPP1 family predicted phage head-tail adaptor
MVGIKETVLLQKPYLVDDDYGTGTNTWTDVAEFKATLTTVGSGELVAMDREQMAFTHRLLIDYHKARTLAAELTPGGRFLIGGLYYDIIGIEHHMRRVTVVTLDLQV